ncbi:MAG: NAD(P)/FAD-dependent oxidoreductase [Anaerolineae bacterium]|nr:NAD(P)/FAD-dependent oxidoreductase [Anaerolineae bacterium]
MSAADALSEKGIACTIFEREASLGGLAGSFRVGGVYLEKFYHHLFTSDLAMAQLIDRLGLGEKLEWLPTTNSYFVNRIYRLSTPLDLLKFSYISLFDRFRLGLLYIRTMFVKDWRPLESITARDWLVQMAGERVYQAVWEPLLRSKFGRYADQVAAVWIWNKLKLRGSSRGGKQEERLGYLRGGFGQALDAWEALLRKRGVEIRLNSPVERIVIEGGRVSGVVVQGDFIPYDRVFVTTAPEIFSSLTPDLPGEYREQLAKIKYLGNVCLVMQLTRSLSDTYWLNIGDPSIPFTGVIEHTNMQRPEIYGGAHLAYISRYLDPREPFFNLSAEELLEAYLPHLQRIFQGFQKGWVKRVWAWRDPYAQPLISLHYSQLRPPFQTPIRGLWLCCMAQVYPEDRGMNYALIYGRRAVDEMLATA